MPHPSPTGSLLADASGPMLLAVAVVRQAWLDVRSKSGAVRKDAERFWRDARAVEPWADVLGVDVQRLQQAVVPRTEEA